MLIVLKGTMWGGKTTYLVEQYHRYKESGKHVVAFRPRKDTREVEEILVSHDGATCNARLFSSLGELLSMVEEFKLDTIIVDEVHMCPEGIAETCLDLSLQGYTVLTAGLTFNFKGEMFHPMPILLSYAEEVINKQAECACGEKAIFNKRLVESEDLIVPGGADMYAPVCRDCFYS